MWHGQGLCWLPHSIQIRQQQTPGQAGSYAPALRPVDHYSSVWLRQGANAGNQDRGAVVGKKINQSNPTAVSFDSWAFRQRLMVIVATFYIDFRLQCFNQTVSSERIKNDGGIDATQGSDQAGAICCCNDWSTRPFKCLRCVVAVNSDYQCITEASCFLKVVEMTYVNQIKMTIGKNQ